MTPREELARLIRMWEESSTRHSLATLAKSTGLSYNTVRRAAQAEVDPNLHTVTRISQFLLDTEAQLNFFNLYYPELTFIAKRCAENKAVVQNGGISVSSFSQTDFQVFALVSCIEVGISVEDVLLEAGTKGEVSIKRLVEGGVVFKQGELLLPTLNGTFPLSAKDSLASLRYIVDSFDLEKINLSGSFSSHRFFGLSDEGVNFAHKILWDALDALDKVKRDHPGFNVMAYGLLSTFIYQAKTKN